MSASQSGCDSFWCALGRFVRALVGIAFLVLGGLMMITFWLMPIGWPLALLGLAITLSDTSRAAALWKGPTICEHSSTFSGSRL